MKTVDKKLQVWHFAQVPCKPFCVDVKDEVEASKIIKVLADQHFFLYDQGIIPDYANAIFVMMLDEGEWVDYWNDDEIMDFDEFEQTYLKDG